MCPNGHHLHGPSNLQGRAGECPECGSRFRIPIIDEAEAEPLSGSDIPATPENPTEDGTTSENPPAKTDRDYAQSWVSRRLVGTEGQSSAVEAHPAEPLDLFQVIDGDGSGEAAVANVSAQPGGPIINLTSGPDGAVLAVHPLAALFIELWAARGEGSRVEVHLESGSVLSPDGYLKSQSQQDYAVLVTKDPDGCSTITVVPWKSISRIILRAVKQVPGEVVR